jgi:hypothetical protein
VYRPPPEEGTSALALPPEIAKPRIPDSAIVRALLARCGQDAENQAT